jgi:hypothetical protein
VSAAIQPELFRPEENTLEANIARLRLALDDRGWHNRRDLCLQLGWREDDLRHTLEALGSEVVRGQRGFKLTCHITRDDLKHATQAADAALSQGKKMIRYALSLKRRLHRVIA